MVEKIRGTGIALLGLVLIAGCIGERMAGSTSVGNPPQGVAAFSMEATSNPTALAKSTGTQDTSISVKDSTGTVFIIEASLVSVGQVQIKLPDGVKCSEAIKPECELDKAKFTTPFVADLLAGTLHPDLGNFLLPVGKYHLVEIKLEEFKPKTPPPGIDSLLFSHTMLIKGTFGYSGKSDRKFSILLDFGEVVSYESDSALQIRETGLNKLILSLDAKKWLAKANITHCLDNGTMTLDSMGDLAVDKSNMCDGLEQVIKAGVKASGSLKEKHE